MEYRMYFFVPYNLSPIQQGIQAGHAALQYAIDYGKSEEFKKFIKNDKTWVVLNGGTTRDIKDEKGERGSMNELIDQLAMIGISHSSFREPDLNYALTAICFLADERVWDTKNYPDFEDFYANTSKTLRQWHDFLGGEKNVILRGILADKHLA